jgi:GTP-binding protein
MAHNDVVFLGGVVKQSDVDRLNLPELPRVAFVGRSNVGKSSLLNALTATKMARVSQTPGKTKEMNFFHWKRTKLGTGDWLLVDLPGYGFAKTGRTLQQEWGKEITQWMRSDDRLGRIVCLVDGRLGFLEKDLQMLEFLKGYELPYVVAFTKMDKWKSSNQKRAAEAKLKNFCKELEVTEYVFVSSIEKHGTHDLFQFLLKSVQS